MSWFCCVVVVIMCVCVELLTCLMGGIVGVLVCWFVVLLRCCVVELRLLICRFVGL